MLTLNNEVSAALQVSYNSSVVALHAVVHVVDNQLVVLLLRDDAVALVRHQLFVIEHPFHWDVILGDANFKYNCCS